MMAPLARFVCLLFVVLFLISTLFLPRGHAVSTITVTSTGDGTADAMHCPGAGNSCTLRDAIAAAAPSGDTIVFSNSTTGGATNFHDGSPHTITLTSGELLIDKSLTITGPGANLLTVSGNQASRVFNIGAGVTVTLDALTIANGKVTGGGVNEGGGIYNNTGTLNVTNSTLSGNSVSGGSNNRGGGGIYNDDGTVNARNTIIAGNTASTGPDVKGTVNSTVNSQGHNLIGNTSGATVTPATGDKFDAAASPLNLGPLQNNGGPTQTHALLPGSVAIDAGDDCVFDNTCSPALASALTTDQRGFTRKSGTHVDIGAVEVSYALNATAGTPQSATVGTAFATPLKATVTESGNPASGVTVTFNAPASGASGTFANGTATTTATTDANGVATATTFTANTTGGSYNVTASAGALSASFLLTNTKLDQTINFGALAAKTYGDADFTVSATATSGLPVSFGAAGNCTISGATVHLTGAGSCTVTASQAGDATYNAAPDVPQSFNIAKADTTTTVNVSDATYDGSQHGATATVTGPGSLSQSLSVSYAGRNGTTYGPSTTAPTNAGDYTASASYAGDSNYNPSSGSKDFSIAKASQTINFAALAAKTYGDADFSVSATATSGLPVSFAASGNCTVAGSTVHITGAGSCTVTAKQDGNANYNAAPDVSRSFNINKAATATALSSSANPSGFGQSVTFTATVTSAAGTPTGTVAFKDGGAAIAGCENVTLSNGQATCTTSALAAGSHAVTADYSGDSNYAASTGTLSGGQTVGGLFAFSQALYTVAERGARVAITVTRTGLTTQPLTVDYATDDGSNPAVFVPCAATTGLASERCDYTRAAGTLHFAANETLKSFTVLVNDDSYTEGMETLTLRLSNPSSGGALGATPVATLEITDDPVESAGNVIDDHLDFVRQHYHDFLNREPDPEGLQFWTNQMTSCGSPNLEVCRVNVSGAFFLSIEFQNTGYLVERVYKTAYGDATGNSTLGGAHQLAVPRVRLYEFLRDTQAIGQDVIVGQGSWQQQLEANKQAFALSFVRRPEFLLSYPNITGAAAFVNLLDQNAGGVLDNSEKAVLINELSPNPSDPALRASVVRKVAEDADLVRSEKNRAFVLMEYFGYLRRNPNDAPDSDHTGYDFWLRKLDQFGGDYVQAEMVKAFLSSDEYRKRFGQ